jgi:hypothetical protein
MHKSDVIWETLDLSGDTEMVNCRFEPLRPGAPAAGFDYIPPAYEADSDAAMAAKIQVSWICGVLFFFFCFN